MARGGESPTTEARNPASDELDTLSAIEIVRVMHAEDASVSAAVGRELPAIAEAIAVIAERIGSGGRLIYLGAGTSGRLGVLDAAECPPTFGSPHGLVIGVIAGGPEALTRAVEGVEDSFEQAADDLRRLNVTSKDVLVGITASGRTPYVRGGLVFAGSAGAFRIGLTCNANSPLGEVVDLLIATVVGPEILSGSTRLKAGTATKMVLNMLTTGAFVRLGQTYGNLMVDLQPTNAKLAARAQSMVMALTGLSEHEAETRLAECAGEIKTAVVAVRRGVSPDEARAMLAAANGRLRTVLEDRS